MCITVKLSTVVEFVRLCNFLTLKGLEDKGNTVGAQARFTVETFSAGRGDLEIIVVNPNGVKETVLSCCVVFKLIVSGSDAREK